MRKQIWLLVGIGLMVSLFLAGCGGGGKKITQNPADPLFVPTVNVPAEMKGTIVFNGPSDFSSGKGTVIYALSASKGLEKVAERAGFGLSFSPNGQYLVYERQYGQNAWETVIADRSWNELASFRDKWGGYYWSPSGRYLMFGCRSEGIYAIDTTSWGITKLVASDDGASLMSPGMTPDETILVWTRYKRGEDLAIFRAPLGGRLTVTFLEVAFNTTSRDRQNTINLFLDNRQLIHVIDDRVLLGDIESSQSWQIANLPELREVKLSPDRQKLACLTEDGLYVYSTASWQEQKVGTNPSRSNSGLAWSPDGGQLAVAESGITTDVALYGLDGANDNLLVVSVPLPRGHPAVTFYSQSLIDWAS